MNLSTETANTSSPPTRTLDFSELAGRRPRGTVIVVPRRADQLTAQGSSQSSPRQPVPLDWLTAKPFPQIAVSVL